MALFGPPDIRSMTRQRKVKGLARALHHKDPGIRRAAAEGLHQLADAAAVESIAAALHRPAESDRVRIALAEALGAIGDPRGAEALVTLLATQPLPSSRLVDAAAGALGRHRDARGVDALIRLLPRSSAVRALSRVGDQRAVEALVEVLAGVPPDQTNAPTAQEVAAALAQLGWDPSNDRVGAIFHLVRRTPPEPSCWGACLAIGEPAVQPIQTWLETTLRADAGADVADAARTLGQIGSPSSAPLLLALLDVQGPGAGSQVAGNRRAALAALEEIGPALLERPEASSVLQLYVRRATAGEARAVIDMAERAGLVRSLEAALGHDDHAIRRLAGAALARMEWEPSDGDARLAFWASTGQWDRVADEGEAGLATLLEWLEAPSASDDRGPLLLALEGLGEAALRPLRAVADTSIPAAEALARFGDSAAFEPLAASADAGSPRAIRALSSLPDARVDATLRRLLRYAEAESIDWDDNPWGADEQERREREVQVAAAVALAERGDPAGVSSLKTGLLAGDSQALNALETLGTDEAATALKAALDEVNPLKLHTFIPLSNQEREDRADRVRAGIRRALEAIEADK